MESKSWQLELDGTSHEVKLLWSYWRGGRELVVDGETVDRSTVPLRWKSSQRFSLGSHRGVVTTRPARRFSQYFLITLELDGREVGPQPGSSKWEAAPR